MTETQRKFLTEYLGQCWHEIEKACFGNVCKRCGQSFVTVFINRTFTTAQDKQDLLERVIERGEWKDFVDILHRELVSMFDSFHDVEEVETAFLERFTMLSPLKTAELICKWKGVE